jgi:hypothetical protein
MILKRLGPLTCACLCTLMLLLFYFCMYSGQPGLWEHEFNNKTILYVGLVMNGTVIPPIIFTNCSTVPEDIDSGSDGKVIYVPDLNQPTAELTIRWLTTVQEYIGKKDLLVHDRGGEYKAQSVQDWCSVKKIETCMMPAAGGAFVNPCDNPYNAQLKKAYFKAQSKTYPEKLKAILKAYYTPQEESIMKYFEHVGWSGKSPTKADVHRLLSEGYRPGRGRERLYEEMRTAYLAWKKCLRSSTIASASTSQGTQVTDAWYVWK